MGGLRKHHTHQVLCYQVSGLRIEDGPGGGALSAVWTLVTLLMHTSIQQANELTVSGAVRAPTLLHWPNCNQFRHTLLEPEAACCACGPRAVTPHNSKLESQ